MKIFLISDIHGSLAFIDAVAGQLSEADVVAIAGDITHAGGNGEAAAVLDGIEKYNRSIVAVHGNWDGEEVCNVLQERGYSVHGAGIIKGDTGFFGVGGSSPTPMHTPCEYSDDQIRDFLSSGYNFVKHVRNKVMLSHTPPRKTRDRTFLGLRGGSSAVREFILDRDINLCLCGHIHEARGTDELGSCLVVNPGAFKGGRYTIVTLSETVTVKEGRAAR